MKLAVAVASFACGQQPAEAFGQPAEQAPAADPNADPFDELAWIADGTPTAEEFARRRLARPAQQNATMGARAILKNPAILVLDEATSALDSSTDADVQGALDEASRGRTTLMVAHRLSTVARADEIIVLDQGRIAERGTHAQLLAKDGLYADLWNRQSRAHENADAEAQQVA